MTDCVEYNIGGLVFTLVCIDEASSLRRRLPSLENLIVLEDEESDCFTCVIIQMRIPGHRWIGHCAIFLSQNVIKPRITSHPEKGRYWVVWDRMVAVISPLERRYEIKKRSFTPYWDMVTCPNGDLLVIDDLDATCLNPEGRQRWQLNGSDRLNDFEIIDKVLICKFDNGTELRHEIE